MSNDDFTADEWDDVTAAPVAAAAVISAVDYSALSEQKELDAFHRFFERSAASHSKSQLVQAVFAACAGDDLEAFREICDRVAAQQSGDTPIEDNMRHIGRVARMVEDRASAEEATAYKKFVYDCALLVARAHREHPLPFANPISRKEDFHLRRLGRELRVRS